MFSCQLDYIVLEMTLSRQLVERLPWIVRHEPCRSGWARVWLGWKGAAGLVPSCFSGAQDLPMSVESNPSDHRAFHLIHFLSLAPCHYAGGWGTCS